MFERFTDRARRVLVLAQEEARLLQHNFIGTEHILLGLLDENEGIAAQALRYVGVSADAIRADIADIQHPGEGPVGSPPFTPQAKKLLELSMREALQLQDKLIGTEHLLLGLIREGEGVAVQVLVGAGVDLAHLRQTVICTMGGEIPVLAFETKPKTREPAVSGPRCPYCSRQLERGGVAYKVLKVPRADKDEPANVADIAFVYCTRCGKVIAHAPFSDIEGESEG